MSVYREKTDAQQATISFPHYAMVDLTLKRNQVFVFIPDLLKNSVNRWSSCMQTVLLAGLALGFSSVSAVAAPRLSCEILQGGNTLKLQFEPVSDPYVVEAIDINERFRFKAVMVGSEQKVDYIKFYAYYLSSGQAVLLHEAKYLSPVPQKNAIPDTLTGQHYLYSPELGREMQYGCALLEVTS